MSQTESSYYACHWYEYFVKHNIPTIKSVLIKGNSLMEIKQQIQANIVKYPFVRLCNASPKDYCKSCLFCDIDELFLALKNSNRTWYMLNSDHGVHVLMRKFVHIDIEARCFISNGRLRAVSCNYFLDSNEQQVVSDMILDFFDIYMDKIPYDRVTIDIGISNNHDDIFIIECNSFGIDMNASAELFDWNEDYDILYNSEVAIFKFKDEFSW